MFGSFGSPWSGIVVAAIAVAVIVGLLLRYRALVRSGSGLPPGAGGARMIGAEGTVVVAHLPGVRTGRVRVLGEEWGVADTVDLELPEGRTVRVVDVTGVRLVVEQVTGSDGGPSDDDRT